MLAYLITHPVCTNEQVIEVYKALESKLSSVSIKHAAAVNADQIDYSLQRALDRTKKAYDYLVKLIYTFKPELAQQLGVKSESKTPFKRQREKTIGFLESLKEVKEFIKTPEGAALALTSSTNSLRKYAIKQKEKENGSQQTI
jgi:hypothetical protein